MTSNDIVTVGLSNSTNEKLNDLKERGIFAEKMDGYRLGVSLALSQGAISEEFSGKTLFNVGSLDPDQTLKTAVESLLPEMLSETTHYRLVERLAEWGVKELHLQAEAGEIDFASMLADNAE